MKVSILMVTYDHERYIAQAIESVLAQDFEADFELVIGEDCSTDRTAEIARTYAEAHPGRVRLLAAERNLGMQANYVRTFEACTGEYLAVLDGDDYWTAPEKLRLQVGFLTQNPDCAICFHACQPVDEAGVPQGEPNRPRDRRARYELRDLARTNLMDSCTVMYRRANVQAFPDWFGEAPMCDWIHSLLHARCGSIGYLDEVMGAYRLHGGGIWGQERYVKRLLGRIRARELVAPLLGPEVEPELLAGGARERYFLSREYLQSGDPARARECLDWCRRRSPELPVPTLKFWLRYLKVLYRSVVA